MTEILGDRWLLPPHAGEGARAENGHTSYSSLPM